MNAISSGAVHRGDLLRALAGGAAVPEHAAVRLFGFELPPDEPAETPVANAPDAEPQSSGAAPVDASTLPDVAPTASQLRFWCAAPFEHLSAEETARRRAMPAKIADATPLGSGGLMWAGSPSRGKPLVEWSRLWPFLREILGCRRPRRAPDVGRIVQRLAKGAALVRIPRKLRRAWLPNVQILLDRRLALAPFWDDYDDLLRRLLSMRGGTGLEVHSLEPASRSEHLFNATPYPPPVRGRSVGDASLIAPLRWPDPSTRVLVLGDLGQLEEAVLPELWLRLGRRLRRRGVTAWALCPCPRSRWRADLARAWNVVAWDRGERLPRIAVGQSATVGDETSERVKRSSRLLTLAGPAIRVERGLLRDLRLLLPASEADAGTEYDAFQSPEANAGPLGFTLPASQIRGLRAAFAALKAPKIHAAVRALRRHHAYCADVFGHMEVVALWDVLSSSQWEELLSAGVLPADALERAREFWRGFVRTLATDEGDWTETAAFGGRDWERLRGEARGEPEMQAVWALANTGSDQALPDSVKPETIAWLRDRLPSRGLVEIGLDNGLVIGGDAKIPLLRFETDSRSCVLSLHDTDGSRLGPCREVDWRRGARIGDTDLERASRVVVETAGERATLMAVQRPYWATRMWYDRSGIHAEIEMRRESVIFDWPSSPVPDAPLVADEVALAPSQWRPRSKPAWAESLRVDAYGVAAEFRVGRATFVLRWIPAGRFRMGSPPDEVGRYDREGPQHEVEISRGFWLGETPVTQGQWRAVAESISRGWLDSLRARRPGLEPWPSRFSGVDEAPVEKVSFNECDRFVAVLNERVVGLDAGLPSEAQWEYACRAGTQGAFGDGSPCTDADGVDPALKRMGWYDENSELRTHVVKSLNPNGWGLYDMHGNVFEWCRDGRREYQARVEIDPEGTYRGGRVVRGGSWISQARGCRAAYRSAVGPEGRYGYLGFRLAAGLEPSDAERRVDPERRSRGAERPKGRARGDKQRGVK